jgi:hypothetical protein
MHLLFSSPYEEFWMFLLIRAAALAFVFLAATAAVAQPVADAGPDQTIDCAPAEGADVTLDGNGSTPGLTYTWTDETQAEVATGIDPVVTLLPGVHVLTLTVDDGAGGTASDEVTVTVNADLPPEIVLKDGSTRLWPPNHKTYPYAAADLVDEVIDDCGVVGPEDVFFTRATSDELDDGQGDGNTRSDVSFAEGCGVAFVRAERTGTKNGRVYELFLQVADDAGNLSDEARFRVRVAHDQAHAADKGPIKARYACGAGCAPAPTPACALAPSAEVAMREGKRGSSLRFRAQGFAAGSVSDEGNQLCLYVDDVLAGGSAAPDKVKLKDKAGFGSLKVSAKGSDLEIPALPIEGDVLRVELHDAAAACVASSFDAPLVNEAGRYEAETD